MKVVLWVVVIALMVLTGCMLISLTKPVVWHPTTTVTFLGFTNTAPGAPATNAWFGIKDIPRESTSWRTVEISHQEGGKWKQWGPLPTMSFNWLYPKPDNFNLAATVPLPATNGRSRVVIELRRNSTGKAEAFLTDVRLNWALWRHRKNLPNWPLFGPSFYITNEFNFSGETNSVGR